MHDRRRIRGGIAGVLKLDAFLDLRPDGIDTHADDVHEHEERKSGDERDAVFIPPKTDKDSCGGSHSVSRLS